MPPMISASAFELIAQIMAAAVADNSSFFIRSFASVKGWGVRKRSAEL
jgi:hypothetical protein